MIRWVRAPLPAPVAAADRAPGRRARTNVGRTRLRRLMRETYRLHQHDLRAIVRNGLYYQHIKNWLEYFPLSQFLFVNGEQLIREPSVEIDKLQRFLNLKPVIKKEHFVHNRRKGFACIIKPIDSKQVKCLSDQKGRKHPVIDSNILNDLKEFYRPSNQMLFNLIKEKPWWSI